MRYLILGNKGMLGSCMEKQFHDTDYIAIDRTEIDLRDKDKVFAYLMSTLPDVVINCTGYTNVDKAEEEEELANEINGYAVGILAKACREIDSTFVHFSTDYVFDGSCKTGNNEDDPTSPLNAYGRSKLLGEHLLLDEMESMTHEDEKEGKYFLIRTSWLFGENGKNFVETMLNFADTQHNSAKLKSINVINDQFGKPTYTKDLCEQTRWLLESNEYGSAIYHITNENEASWYDFAREIFSVAGKEVDMIACGSAEYRSKAKRPKYGTLNNNKLPKLRSWQEALKDYISKKL